MTSKACRASLLSGSELMPTLPRLMPKTGSASGDEQAARDDDADDGAGHDGAGDPVPEAAARVVGSAGGGR